ARSGPACPGARPGGPGHRGRTYLGTAGKKAYPGRRWSGRSGPRRGHHAGGVIDPTHLVHREERLMASDKIRLGVIGANPTVGWAPRPHLPALVARPDIELTAVCTTVP